MATASRYDVLLRPLRPALRTIQHYDLHKLRRDVVAGLTVSVVEVPQAMAYALVAGVPPVYGIYASILQGVVGALLSSGDHMRTGPTNTQSLLIASAAKAVVAPDAPPELYLQIVFALAVFKGLIQLCFAAARLGELIRYVSRSVIVGLTAGAGVLIFVGQLPALLGVHTLGPDSPLPGVLGRLHQVATHFDQLNGRAVAIGAAVVAVVAGVRLLSPLLPGTLAAVVLSAAAVALLGWDRGQVPLIAPLPKGLPHFMIPWDGFAYARELFSGALALAILGMLESVAIAKSLAGHTGERIGANREFFAQGVANAVTGFFQCIPGSGSFTRSALDHAAGAATRLAAVFNAGFVAAIFLLLADQARFVPLASLAGVLFVIAWGLIDWRYMLRLARTSRSDAAVCFATFAATLVAPLEYAIFIGIFLNLALYLRHASRLQMTEMIELEAEGGRPGTFAEIPLQDRAGERPVVFLQVEGQLFFGVADELEDRLNHLSNGQARVFIFRLKRTHAIDSTVLGVLERFTRQTQARGGHVILCGLRPELMRVVSAYGLLDLIGRANVFQAGRGVFASARQALFRARQLIGHSIDERDLGDDLEDEQALTYQI